MSAITARCGVVIIQEVGICRRKHVEVVLQPLPHIALEVVEATTRGRKHVHRLRNKIKPGYVYSLAIHRERNEFPSSCTLCWRLKTPLILHDDVIKWKHYWPLWGGNSPVTGEFPSQRPVTGSFDVFFVLCLIKRLSKQSWRWWFETSSRSSWRDCNDHTLLAIGGDHFKHFSLVVDKIFLVQNWYAGYGILIHPYHNADHRHW